MTCTNCGHELPEGAHFCPNCGAPAPGLLETSERRIVTVLFADLVDSTGLAGRLDPERSREVLSAFFDAVSEELLSLRGQPEKFIGDAVMAVFGLPQVHEDDAIRAIRAGQAIVERTEKLGVALELPTPLEVRVGIEAGDVATGVGPAGQLLVTGPTVNVAARLQQAAEPGEVLVGETARALTRMAVAFGEPRTVPAKGFDALLTGYPVESLTTRSARRTIPLIGRRAELSVLKEVYSRTTSIARPHLVTLIGEPGIGKTRLVEELVAGLEAGVTVLEGRVQAYEWGATFAPISEMVRELAEVGDGEPPAEARARLRETVARCCLPAEVERITDRLALALDLDAEDQDQPMFVQEVQSGFADLIDGLGRLGPVILFFDDIQQAGPPMLDLIERIASSSHEGPCPVLIVAAGREEILEIRPTWGSAAPNEARIRLDPLSREESVELARRAGGGKLRATTVDRVAARAGGNPFFIVETTGMLLRQEDTLPSHLVAPLPPTVQAVVAARLDDLPPRLREVARTVSVFLYSLDLAELKLVLPHAQEEDLRLLEDEEILVREVRPRLRWRFRHETVRDVAYASLPKRERLRLHVLIADNVIAETGRIAWAAEHLERAALASLDLDTMDRTLASRAADALADAGDLARRRMEGRSAVELYERALAFAGPQERWGVREARIYAGIGEARYWLSEYADSVAALERAETLAEKVDDAWSLSLALRFHADMVLNVDGDIDRAEELFDRALASAERSSDPRAVARTLLFAAWIPMTREDWERARSMWERALRLARENGDRWAQIRALTSLAAIPLEEDRYDEAKELIEPALALANELGDRFSIAVATTWLGRVHRYTGDAEEALRLFDRAIQLFTELGARWEIADALMERGGTYRDVGRLDEAEADLETSLRISEELGERSLVEWTWRSLAKVAERRGDRAVAEERTRRADEEEARRPR